MLDLSRYSLSTVFVASLLALLAASELGHVFGLRAKGEANIATLEAAMLGLLALMIGFSFSMAMSRYDARRDALLEEANAIGTAALRAYLLPAPHAAVGSSLLRSYVQIRLDLVGLNPTAEEWTAAITRSNEIQDALWRDVESVMAEDNSPVPTGLYIQALNQVIDSQEKRLTALRNRVPNIALWGLYGIAIVSIGFTGYASGTAARRWRLPVYTMSVLVATVILLIQDLDRPSSGFIAVDQQPMIDTAESLARYKRDFERAGR
jgi:hypothetical protein